MYYGDPRWIHCKQHDVTPLLKATQRLHTLGLRPRRRKRGALAEPALLLVAGSQFLGLLSAVEPRGCWRSGVVDPGQVPANTEVQGVKEGAGLSTTVTTPASQFTLFVMHPCSVSDEAAAEDLPRPTPAPSSTGGPRRRGSGGVCVSKTCTYEGCSETTSQVAKQRKPWMCKKHRNKMYKDKYKKKKSDQALNCGGAASVGSAGNVKLEESTDNILSMVKQKTGSFGDRPARPTLLEQVLNQKRLSLLRSPEVVQFLQKQQQLLNQQVLEQRQQQFPGASM
ncbi:regulatory factor X-associated protein [Fukomys damarensis]|uniref:regulatory factor X-associated protein n=1 Tax=Fukomys damarensis TaxID=885580 RepID=UPI00053F37B4|nr:regulatory factor X-associated protein [Fukomys damarensis]